MLESRHKLASTRELKYIVIIPASLHLLADVGIMISTTMKRYPATLSQVIPVVGTYLPPNYHVQTELHMGMALVQMMVTLIFFALSVQVLVLSTLSGASAICIVVNFAISHQLWQLQVLSLHLLE